MSRLFTLLVCLIVLTSGCAKPPAPLTTPMPLPTPTARIVASPDNQYPYTIVASAVVGPSILYKSPQGMVSIIVMCSADQSEHYTYLYQGSANADQKSAFIINVYRNVVYDGQPFYTEACGRVRAMGEAHFRPDAIVMDFYVNPMSAAIPPNL